MLKSLPLMAFMMGFLFIFSFSSWAGTEGEIFGVITDSEGIAVSLAQVRLLTLEGKIIKETRSSLAGEYRFFPVVIGQYKIQIQVQKFNFYENDIRVSSGGKGMLDVTLSPTGNAPAEIVVEVKAKKRLIQGGASVSSSELSKEQIAKLPQGMEAGLPRLVSTTTPGVVQGPFGQMFFRGNHASIQYQIDGVQLPDSPSGTFGQAISPRNIDQMEIITGGIPAEYGQRLSAVVNIITKSGSEKAGGEIELNYGSYFSAPTYPMIGSTSPHLLYGGSSDSGSVHYYFSLNYSRNDRGIDTPQPQSIENPSQGGAESVHNLATGYNEFAKIDWLASNEDKMIFILFHSNNDMQIPNFPLTFSPNDPSGFFQKGYTDGFGNTRVESPTNNYLPSDTHNTQSETNFFTQTVWKHTFSEKSFLQFAPYYKYSLLRVTNDPVKDLSTLQFISPGSPRNSPYATGPGSLGLNPIDGSIPSSFAQNRHVNHLGLKGDYSYRANEAHLLKTGFQLQSSRSEGWVSIQTDLNQSPFIDGSPSNGQYESIYIQDDFTIVKPLTLSAGLRLDATQFSFSEIQSNDSMLQPRIGLAYLATDTTKLHVFYGKLFQPAPLESLRYQFNATHSTFTPLQSYDIKAEKDDFFEVGIAQQFLNRQVATLNVHYKEGVNILDDTQLLNTSIAQPYNFERGFAYGVEIGIKGQLSQVWSEFFNYSYQIAKGQGISGGIWTGVTPSPIYQMLDHVQVHTANSGITYSKNNFWWTGQWVYGSGLRTGENNSLNLSSHSTFDTTVGYEFAGNDWFSRFKLSMDVLNILDNRYPVTIANGFNRSSYAAPRQVYLRLTKEF